MPRPLHPAPSAASLLAAQKSDFTAEGAPPPGRGVRDRPVDTASAAAAEAARAVQETSAPPAQPDGSVR